MEIFIILTVLQQKLEDFWRWLRRTQVKNKILSVLTTFLLSCQYARKRSSELVDEKTALTSVSYLGEMTREVALGGLE